jgi:hypothetical protein
MPIAWLAPAAAAQTASATAPAPCQVAAVADLPRCVSVGERLRVLTTDRRRVEGDFRGYAEGRLVLGSRGDRIVSFDDRELIEVAVIRQERSTERMAETIGGSLGIALIAVGSGTVRTGADAIGLMAGMAALGGAVGYLVPVDAPHVVLRRSEAALPEPAAGPVHAPVFASEVARLPRLLQRDDRIRLRRADTTPLEGRYAGIDGDVLLVQTDDRIQRIDGRELLVLERLTTRRPSARKWAVIGGAALLGLAWIGATAPSDDADPEAEPVGVAGVVGAGIIGAGGGAALARLVTLTDPELLFYRPSAMTPTSAATAPAAVWRMRF